MPSPVICIRDTSIKNGQLMVKDLYPNRSLANPVIDPEPQGPRYLRVVETPTLPVLDDTVIAKTVSGLSAYLLVTLDLQTNGANITPAQAEQIAIELITDMRAGNGLSLAEINVIIQEVGGGPLNATGLGLGASTATVNNILQILSGATFTVPAGYDLEDAQNAAQFLSEADQASKFSAFHNPIAFEDSSFWISLAKGDLKSLSSSRTVNNVVLDPYVVVYDGAGSVQ